MTGSPRGKLLTYNSNNAIWLEESIQRLQELQREEWDRLSSTRENIMKDIVVLLRCIQCSSGSVSNRILDHGGVVSREPEILNSIFIDDGVDFHDGGVNSMGNHGRWRRPNPETA